MGELRPYWFDSLAEGVFNWHGFVYPILLSMLTFGESWKSSQIAVVLLSYVTFIVILIAIFMMRITTYARIAIVIISVSLLLDFRARPETTGLLFIMLMLLWHYKFPSFGARSNTTAIVAGTLYACLLFSHPALFMTAMPSYGLYIAYQLYGQRKVISRLAIYIVLFCIGFALGAILLQATMYPEPLSVWFKGVFHLGGRLAGGSPHFTNDYSKYFIFLRNLPVLALYSGFSVLLLIHVFGKCVFVTNNTIWWKLIIGLSAFTACYFYYRLGVKVPSKYYNITGLIVPNLIILCAVFCAEDKARPRNLGMNLTALFDNFVSNFNCKEKTYKDQKTILKSQYKEWGAQKSVLFVLLFLVTGSALSGQSLWIAQWTMEVGKVDHYRDLLRNRIISFSEAGFQICTDSSGMTASPDFATSLTIKMSKPFTPQEKRPDSNSCDLYIRVQAQRNLATPGKLNGFTPLENQFVPADRYPIQMRPLHLAYALFISDSTTKTLPANAKILIPKD